MLIEYERMFVAIVTIDIVVGNCQIRGAKPTEDYQNMPMPTDQDKRIAWWQSVDLPMDRLNNRNLMRSQYYYIIYHVTLLALL